MSNVTGTGVDIEICGQQYSLQPLRFEDMEWLELRLRARVLETARLSLSDDMSPAEKTAITEIAFAEADKIDVFSSIRSLFTPVGITWILWRMARRSHPDLTLDDTYKWTADKELMARLTPTLTLLMGVKKNPTSPETAEIQKTESESTAQKSQERL